jgi:hypothetical protein
METGVANFLFKECMAPSADELMRFFIKSIKEIQFISKRKPGLYIMGIINVNVGKLDP